MDNLEVEVKVEEKIKEDKPEKKKKRRTWLGLPIFSWVFFGIAVFVLFYRYILPKRRKIVNSLIHRIYGHK